MIDLARILIAPLAWLAAFSAVYGLHGLLCGHGVAATAFGVPLGRAVLVAALAFAVAVQGGLLLVLMRRASASSSPFVTFVSRTTGWVFLAATVWSLFPVLAASYCL
jgi:hypothetical protein